MQFLIFNKIGEAMKKSYKTLLGIIIIALGLSTGSVFQSNSYAFSSCDGTTCENDIIIGFRCFGGVNNNYTCDDSDYPNGCTETRCE